MGQYLLDKAKAYPYAARSPTNKGPRPEHVKGDFIRVPFSFRGYAIWVFKVEAERDELVRLHPGAETLG